MIPKYFFFSSNQSPLSSTLNNIKPKVTLSDEGEVGEPNTKLHQFSINRKEKEQGQKKSKRKFYSIYGIAKILENSFPILSFDM